ncbi:MAG: M48 family metallopeptidase [Candidatus Gastranaerophilales bacterium]|nr:M48 family metallopeptidase [Candidatus Gastranaerophilales bacterium]
MPLLRARCSESVSVLEYTIRTMTLATSPTKTRHTKGSIMEPTIYTPAELRRLQVLDRRYRNFARQSITKRVVFYHALTGGDYTSITIRDQKTRWGSCSSKGTLSFNYRLIYAPSKVMDYVVVHELCHLTHMNHSKNFWAMVERIMPDYRAQKAWLKEHGQELTVEHYMAKQGIPLKIE